MADTRLAPGDRRDRYMPETVGTGLVPHIVLLLIRDSTVMKSMSRWRSAASLVSPVRSIRSLA